MELQAIKQLDNGRIGFYGVLFGTKDDTDLSNHYFDAATEYWLDRWPVRPLLYGHGTEGMKDTPVIGTLDVAEKRDIGIWFEGQLDKAHKYHDHIGKMIEMGVLKPSSDSIQHLLQGAKQDNGALHIECWPLAAVSLTTHPAEYRMPSVEALKSAFTAIGGELGEVPDKPAQNGAEPPINDNVAAKATDAPAVQPQVSRTFADQAAAAHETVTAFTERAVGLAALKARDGKALPADRVQEITAVVDGLAPLLDAHAALKAILPVATPAVPVTATQNVSLEVERLRLAQLQRKLQAEL